ncbi:MAG: type II 3-dehydroquinate dehydratase [Clostridia bacterium]|nr:type II 3-dehydroquinate dehydratase [Clostridia bacterium]
MKILVLNGPNINMLGIREPHIYGSNTYQNLIDKIQDYCDKKGVDVSFFQSNHEGALVDAIQQAYFDKIDGIVFNPAAYTHTSVAILDAIKAVSIPTVEVHISKVEERDSFRQISYIREIAIKTITGKGFDGYLEAVDALIINNESKN